MTPPCHDPSHPVPLRWPAAWRTLALSLAWLPALAQAVCTSEGAPAPQAVLERFISADCATCWTDPATPAAAQGVLALDWVVPGPRGDDGPLSAVALREAEDRLAYLGRAAPDAALHVTTLRRDKAPAVRLAQGDSFNDYIGTSIELKGGGRGPWPAWLLLAEALPAGTEGSPVERLLVRNVFRPPWEQATPRAVASRLERRSMQIHAGAQPERLRLVALVHDAQGRMRGITQTICRP